MADREEDVWYQCQRCTNCCKWEGDVVLGDGVRRNLVGVDNVTKLRKGRRGIDARCLGVGVLGVAPRPERVRVADLFRVGHLERQVLERRVEPVVRVAHDAKRHASLV